MQTPSISSLSNALLPKNPSPVQAQKVANLADKFDEIIFHAKRTADNTEKSLEVSNAMAKASQEMFKQNALTGGFLSKIGHNLSVFLPVGLITGLVSSVSLPIVTAKLLPWLKEIGLL